MRTLVSPSKSKKLTNSTEDYLRAIYLLDKNNTGAGVTKIAAKLGLSKSTVSERVKDLEKNGLVKSAPYGTVTLTKSGNDIGEKMTYKHRLIEVFLHQTLGLPIAAVHEEAERLEHAFSDKAIQQLAKFLDYPTADPHGSALPKIKKWK